jgi:hypothetical protein
MKLFKKNLLSALIFALIIAVSMVIYLLLPYEKSDFDKLIIQCVITSALLSFLNVLIYNAVSNKKKLPLAAGGYTSSVVYVVLAVAISILFSVYYRHAEKTYIILLTVITAVFIVASILIYIIGKSTASNAAKVEKSSATFKKFEYIMESICRDNENPVHSATLEKILEAIKSCDQSSYVDTDNEIYYCLEQLKAQISTGNTDQKKIKLTCEKIFALIKQRTAEVSGLKLGGI